jgi:hypothetical protein
MNFSFAHEQKKLQNARAELFHLRFFNTASDRKAIAGAARRLEMR